MHEKRIKHLRFLLVNNTITTGTWGCMSGASLATIILMQSTNTDSPLKNTVCVCAIICGIMRSIHHAHIAVRAKNLLSEMQCRKIKDNQK